MSGGLIPVRLLRGETNRGLNGNIEAVVANCTGDVLVLADQDDWWSPDKIAVIRSAFDDPDVTLWFSDAELVDAEGRRMGARAWNGVAFDAEQQRLVRSGGGLPRLIHGMTVTGATMAVRASVARVGCPMPRQPDPPHQLYRHDGWFAVLAALLGRVVIDARPLTSYRQHADQLTGIRREPPRVAVPTVRGLQRRLQASQGRRAQLADDFERVTLVADRLRDRGVTDRCRPNALGELFAMEEFYSVRSLPRGARGRARSILRMWADGRYAAYARGLRTALADLSR